MFSIRLLVVHHLLFQDNLLSVDVSIFRTQCIVLFPLPQYPLCEDTRDHCSGHSQNEKETTNCCIGIAITKTSVPVSLTGAVVSVPFTTIVVLTLGTSE